VDSGERAGTESEVPGESNQRPLPPKVRRRDSFGGTLHPRELKMEAYKHSLVFEGVRRSLLK